MTAGTDKEQQRVEHTGLVYLVGAGPGDPDLLTIKGMKALEKADVVIYDRLIAPEILEYAKPDCERIYVGKSPGKHYRNQNEINELLISKAREAQVVVRLKGGDPFVFGRGGEEALALTQNRIPFEVVSGVTSAVAVPAAAGIPVTHRGLASSFTVITGHEDPSKDEEAIAWEHVAHTKGTLVFLMGIANLSMIADKLMAHGMQPETPVAVIESGTTPSQRTVTARLDTITAQASASSVVNPAIIVVGEVVTLRETLAWFEARPLFGKHILVTRARPQASKLSQALSSLGARISEVPVIAFAPPSNPEELRQAIREIGSFRWLVLTSANGVKALVAALHEQSLDVRKLAGVELVAIGPATRAALESEGLRGVVTPNHYYAEGIVETLQGLIQKGERLLLARAEDARDALPLLLAETGAQVKEVAAYKTIAAEVDSAMLKQSLAAGDFDAVTFTSSSTVHRLLEQLDGDTSLLASIERYSIGPITSDTLRSYGLEPTAQAEHFCIEGLVRTLVDRATKQEGQHPKRAQGSCP